MTVPLEFWIRSSTRSEAELREEDGFSTGVKPADHRIHEKRMGQTTKCNKDVIRGKSELPFIAAKTLEPGMLAAQKSFRHARREADVNPV